MIPCTLTVMFLVGVTAFVFWLMSRDYDNLRKP